MLPACPQPHDIKLKPCKPQHPQKKLSGTGHQSSIRLMIPKLVELGLVILNTLVEYKVIGFEMPEGLNLPYHYETFILWSLFLIHKRKHNNMEPNIIHKSIIQMQNEQLTPEPKDVIDILLVPIDGGTLGCSNPCACDSAQVFIITYRNLFVSDSCPSIDHPSIFMI